MQNLRLFCVNCCFWRAIRGVSRQDLHICRYASRYVYTIKLRYGHVLCEIRFVATLEIRIEVNRIYTFQCFLLHTMYVFVNIILYVSVRI